MNLKEIDSLDHCRPGLSVRTVVTKLRNLNTIRAIACQGGWGQGAAHIIENMESQRVGKVDQDRIAVYQ